MRDLVIGDMHFGIKTNSINWLESQLDYFNNQIIDAIKTENPDRIVFLGDLFDIRYAVNQQVGMEVKKLLRNLSKIYSKDIIFVAGNHDFYTPLEKFNEYNAYDLLFGYEFTQVHKNIKFIINDPYLGEDGTLFLPWYWTEIPEHFDEILYNFKMGEDVKRIYCHTDLQIWPGARITSLKGVPVYSGHIHYTYYDTLSNLYNLGAALQLTFNDVNSHRHFFIISEDGIEKKIENTTTPKFYRFYNEKIFNLTETEFNCSYVELCISNSNSNTARYKDQVDLLKTSYMGIAGSIRTNIIDDDNIQELPETGEGFNTNINNYIENNIPEHLNTKFNLIKTKVNGLTYDTTL